MQPLQCWVKRANDFRPSAFVLEVQGSIMHMQIHFFEYETSRGLQVFSEKEQVLTQSIPKP